LILLAVQYRADRDSCFCFRQRKCLSEKEHILFSNRSTRKLTQSHLTPFEKTFNKVYVQLRAHVLRHSLYRQTGSRRIREFASGTARAICSTPTRHHVVAVCMTLVQVLIHWFTRRTTNYPELFEASEAPQGRQAKQAGQQGCSQFTPPRRQKQPCPFGKAFAVQSH
jgi:hypothetical protein